jgi:hypothetical protein
MGSAPPAPCCGVQKSLSKWSITEQPQHGEDTVPYVGIGLYPVPSLEHGVLMWIAHTTASRWSTKRRVYLSGNRAWPGVVEEEIPQQNNNRSALLADLIHSYIRKHSYWHAVAQLVEALRYKVAGSSPDGVNGMFHWHNPSGRTGVDSTSNRNA